MSILEKTCVENTLDLIVYCFMPDHIHLIVSSNGTNSIIDFIRIIKSKITLASYQYGFEHKIFQPRFFDRFIRNSDGLLNEVIYILNNPVRKGIVEDYRNYPYYKCYIDI
jgi:putative transposase